MAQSADILQIMLHIMVPHGDYCSTGTLPEVTIEVSSSFEFLNHSDQSDHQVALQ